ncbi:MAG: hypothetical protein ACM3ZE_02625, partial [Myxococcales bacterium]
MFRTTRTVCTLCLLLDAVCVPSVALAADAVTTAREIGYAGAQLYESGDYAGAEQKFQQAFSTLKAPTLGLWYARALAKQGKLTEAASAYREVV